MLQYSLGTNRTERRRREDSVSVPKDGTAIEKKSPSRIEKGGDSGQGVKLRNSSRRVEREEMGERDHILRLTESYWAPPKILLLGILRLSGRKKGPQRPLRPV